VLPRLAADRAVIKSQSPAAMELDEDTF